MPTGGGSGQFQSFTQQADISTENNAGSTTIRNLPYAFRYAGNILNGALDRETSSAYWWARTVNSANYAYDLAVNASRVNPTNGSYRYYGFSLRCIATATS